MISTLVATSTLVAGPGALEAQERPDGRLSYRAAAASVVVPGTGQLLRGERRGLLYLAADAAMWLVFADGRADGRSGRSAYRELARDVARVGAGARPEGDFEYYERLTRWTRSGAFDREPAVPGLQPETDPSTFNGDAWRLARSLFWGGGEVPPDARAESAALEFYRERAYGEEFTWDWSGATAEQERFARLIRESDDAFGRARLAVGGLVANRLLSGVDVWLSARTPGTTELRVVPGEVGPTMVPRLVLRWRAGGRG